MSAAPWAAAGDASALASALFAEPTRFTELVRGGGALPTDAIVVMRAAAEGVRIGRPESLSHAQRAALFFVEHVLLAHEADHYRELGLNRDATAEQIREHYRIMMAIFHPDRRGWADSDREKLSARINLAHHILRDDYRRAAYDLERMQARPRTPTPKAVAARTRIHRNAPAASCAERIPLTVRRHFPQYVLGGVAFVGLATVLTVYLNRAPAGAIGASRGARPPTVIVQTEREAPRGAEHIEPVSKVRLSGPDATPARPLSVTNSIDRGSARPMPSDRSRPEPSPAGAATASAEPSGASASQTERATSPTAGTKVVIAPPAENSTAIEIATAPPTPVPGGRIGTASAGDQTSERVVIEQPRTSLAAAQRLDSQLKSPQPISAEPHTSAGRTESTHAAAGISGARASGSSVDGGAGAGRAVEATLVSPAPLSANDANRLVSQFSVTYQHGDIERFMDLFADDARSEAGRKAQIRKDYEQLFRTTHARRIEIVDMRWSPNSASAQGEGGYLVRVSRKGETGEETYSGSIRLELTRRGSDVLISGLFHKPSN